MSMSKPNTADTALNREGWLNAFAAEIAPVIKQRTGLSVPLSKMRFSVSFPRTRSTPNRKGSYTIGQCFHGGANGSGLHEILINPLRDVVMDDNGHGIGETIIHEMLHACLALGTGHKAPFARAAKQMGLNGKGADGKPARPTATIANEDTIKLVREIEAKIGPYPHQAISGEWGTKQTTRLLKVMCLDCGYMNEAGNGYTSRITMTWIENAGLPTCPCGNTMTLVDKSVEQEFVALKPVESSCTYRVPNEAGDGHDDRFQIRRVSSEHFGDRWSVIDFGERTVQDMFSDASPRIVAAEGREDALNMIDSIREGFFTWDDLDADEGEEWDEGEDDGSNPLADPDLDPFLYLDQDEEETPDYPEDAKVEESWVREHPTTGKKFVHHFDHEAEAGRRDAAGSAKSERIAAEAEAAMD